MGQEIELKFFLPDGDWQRLKRLGILARAGKPSEMTVENRYFDTPDLALHRAGVALRLRLIGGQWLQTVKCAGESVGGLSRRPEWETAYHGVFDFSAVTGRLGRWLSSSQILPRLQPVFETNFHRSAYLLNQGGTRIELALDRGWIAAAGRREPLCELELEVLSPGETPLVALFDLAGQLAGRISLVPACQSKAERGYNLFLARAPRPVKADDSLSFAGDAQACFRATALSCLDHLQANQPGVVAGDDPEYVHQMRVALRRLRTLLQLFRPLLKPEFQRRTRSDIDAVVGLLGAVRDCDVVHDTIVLPALPAMVDPAVAATLSHRVLALRARAFDQLRTHLRAPAWGQWLIQLQGALHGAPLWTEVAGGEDFVVQRLMRLQKKIRHQAEVAAADPDSATARHGLRILIKRYRYALEFFPEQSGRRQQRHLAKLSRLQEELGQLNDLGMAGEILLAAAGDVPSLLGTIVAIGEWHRPRYRALEKQAARTLAGLDFLPAA